MNSLSFNAQLENASRAYRAGQFSEAFSLYKQLALGGHAESQVFVGWMLLVGKGVVSNPAEAEQWFARAASLGSPQGLFYWARYLTSKGCHADAFTWYQKAAAVNYLPAIFWVGYALTEGKGIPSDIREGYKYLKRASERGHIYARRQLAVLDLRGHRGPMYRLLGAGSFVVALIQSIFISKEEADKLRA